RMMRDRRGGGWLAAGVLALVLWSGDAAAQRVEGRVVDQETGAPVAGAAVLLLTERGDTARSTRSDARGGFVLQARRPGNYRLAASRLGYRDAASPVFDLLANEEIQVDLRMSTTEVVLAPLTVRARPADRHLAEAGFYEREEQFGRDGLREGYFLGPEDLERMNAGELTDLFRNVPGVYVTGSRPPTIVMSGGCQPVFYVNGAKVPRYGGTGRVVYPSSLLAVEVYNKTAVPHQYMLDARDCGVILFWTK
ncbi:MAG TPA: carboxypeptidase regulatory-like domain-containing protein, partial [Longimicrobium sp.]|nr:carboxypeptidase regulatory-like domain-containing protein [Longimicrobium sp.]